MKNWKTTLAGAISAAVIIINQYSGINLPEAAVIAICIFIVSLFMKDFDTTGVGRSAKKTRPKINDYEIHPEDQ